MRPVNTRLSRDLHKQGRVILDAQDDMVHVPTTVTFWSFPLSDHHHAAQESSGQGSTGTVPSCIYGIPTDVAGEAKTAWWSSDRSSRTGEIKTS